MGSANELMSSFPNGSGLAAPRWIRKHLACFTLYPASLSQSFINSKW